MRLLDEFGGFIAFMIIVIALCAFTEYHKFESIKKYYPNITYNEYIFLGDKLRIIPNER